MNLSDALQHYQILLSKIQSFDNINTLLYWDMITGMPHNGIQNRSDDLAMIGAMTFDLTTGAEMGELLDTLSLPEYAQDLSKIQRRSVQKKKLSYDRFRVIPKDFYQEMIRQCALAENYWAAAKKNNDFAGFAPYLKTVMENKAQLAQIWGYEKHPYNALLPDYEQDMNVELLDDISQRVKEFTIDLLGRIQASSIRCDESILEQHFDRVALRSMNELALRTIGFDWESGRLDESVHPMTTGAHPGDVRITTRYPDLGLDSVFSTLHEGGHALYEQGCDPSLVPWGLAEGCSMGLHESQSRLYENFVGLNKHFLKFLYPRLQEAFPSQLSDVGLDDFYLAVNQVKPSLIRTMADEVTYNLHIICRYELEKAVLTGDLMTDDLPAAWNDAYRKYLGVTPTDDAQGVLQDVHWSSGMVGYFPTYMLGNLYSAQIYSAAQEAMPDLEQQMELGNLLPLREYLRENVHTYGSLYTPSQMLTRVTGEALNVQHWIDLMERKYSQIYCL